MDAMQSLMFLGRRTLAWREVPRPTLQTESDALVRPFVAARCDGDKLFLLHDFSRPIAMGAKLGLLDAGLGHAVTNPFCPPFAYGHEGVAEVIACGSAVKNFVKGDRVIVPWALSCGACGHCALGETSACTTRAGAPHAFGFGKAFGDNGGMLSDCLRIPAADHLLVKVPRWIDPVVLASASDNVTDGYRSVAEPLSRRPGSAVLIVGGSASSVGLYAAGIAVALGGNPVHYVDTSRTRLAIAARLGAQPVARSRGARWFASGTSCLPGGAGFAISVDASSTTRGLHYALRALGREGICTALGFYLRSGTPLPLWDMYLRGVTLKLGLTHSRAVLPAVLELIAGGRFDPSLVTSVVATWEDAPRLFTAPHVKPVVHRAPLWS